MKTDRELLELAAKAAGICESLEWFEKENCFVLDNVVWNPITDDGDALRLAVMLSMMIARRININGEFVIAEIPGRIFEAEPVGEDWYTATRRAIVRAAAAIGETE
jgi:hypothetical protein